VNSLLDTHRQAGMMSCRRLSLLPMNTTTVQRGEQLFSSRKLHNPLVTRLRKFLSKNVHLAQYKLLRHGVDPVRYFTVSTVRYSVITPVAFMYKPNPRIIAPPSPSHSQHSTVVLNDVYACGKVCTEWAAIKACRHSVCDCHSS